MMDAALSRTWVVLITKNESDLIDDFLEFYGRVVGSRSRVVVVDNGSSCARVQKAYDAHRAAGGRVIVDARSFRTANVFMSEHMASLIAEGGADWILPLETDEFLFARGNGQAAVESVTPERSRRALATCLASQPGDVGVVRYGAFLGSLVDPADPGYADGAYTRPVTQIHRFYDQGWDKLIVRAAAFAGMQQWCHHAAMRPGYREAQCPGIGLLHFHQIGLRRQVERALPVVVAYGYLDPNATLDEQLRAARALKDAPIACGHKLNYVCDHLERKATLVAFRRHLGRLPSDPAEMARYAHAPSRSYSPEDAVRRDRALGTLGRMSNGNAQTWNALLYHERRECNDVEYQYKIEIDAPEVPPQTTLSCPTPQRPSTAMATIGFV